MDLQQNIGVTIIRLTIFKLRRLIAREISQLAPSQDREILTEEQILFHRLVTQSARSNPQMNQLMALIFKYHERQLLSDNQELEQAEIQFLARLETKRIIMDLIRKELQAKSNNKFSMALKEEEENEVEAASQAQEKRVLVEEDASSPNSPPRNGFSQTNYEVKANKVEQVQSDHFLNFQQHFTLQTDPIDPQAELSEIKFSLQKEYESNVVEQSTKYGHFLYGDHILEIEDLFQVEAEMFALVSWQPRWNGDTPESSVLQISTIREHSPRLLAGFLESYLSSMRAASN